MAYGPYLETVMSLSFGGFLLLLVKAFVFTMKPHMEGKVYNLKISWAMPVLLLSSALFGLAHVVIAYRKTCGARKKLMYHKIDQEAVKYLLYCFVICLELCAKLFLMFFFSGSLV